MRGSRRYTFLSLLSLMALTMWGTIWYVSPGGNDETGDGSPFLPFKSIGRAVLEAIQGDTIHLTANSRYVEGKTLIRNAKKVELGAGFHSPPEFVLGNVEKHNDDQ